MKNQFNNLEELIEKIIKELKNKIDYDSEYGLYWKESGKPFSLKDLQFFLRQALIRVAKETARAGIVGKKELPEIPEEIRKRGSIVEIAINQFNQAIKEQQKQLKEFLGDL